MFSQQHRKWFDFFYQILSTKFFKKMYGDHFVEFPGGYWGLMSIIGLKQKKSWSSPDVFKDLYRQSTIVKNSGFKCENTYKGLFFILFALFF